MPPPKPLPRLRPKPKPPPPPRLPLPLLRKPPPPLRPPLRKPPPQQAALDAAAAQLDPDNLIAKIEASSLSVVEKNLLKAIVEAARNSPELLQGAADQVAEKIGN